jgi:hypothetical protein
MKKFVPSCAMGALALALSTAAGQPVPFTPGNLVVLQAGEDGQATALTSAATRLFIKEIDINSGAVVQTIPVPFTAATSGNRAVTQSGTATSEGALTRSVDGKSLVFVGYNADAGTASVVGTASSAVARVVAVVNCNGVIDSTTALEDAYSANNIRSAVSTNGTDLWTAGTAANPGGGVRYATLGSTSSLFLNDNGAGGANAPTNVRIVNIFNGQLYCSSASGTYQGVSTVGSGIPTAINQTITLLNGFPTATGPSSYDFYFANASTLYVADDRSLAAGGGIQKWTESGGTWTLQYTLNPGSGSIRNLTGKTSTGVTTLYATSGGTSANSIVSVVDNGAGSSFTTLASTGSNTWWRGIDFAPSGCTTPGGCYANCDGSTGSPLLTANDFQCFLNKYAAGDTYANCDGSTGTPLLTANDFQCFLNKFAAGCT